MGVNSTTSMAGDHGGTPAGRARPRVSPARSARTLIAASLRRVPLPRLRQVVLAARDLAATCRQLEEGLGRPPGPYADPGVGRFGLANAVYAVGDTFLEVVTPLTDDAPAARWLDRRGGDSGYMAMVQVPDVGQARARLDALGVRVVWEVALDDIADLHLHPRDVPGAILALTAASPSSSWRWGGPAWTPDAGAFAPSAYDGGVLGLTVAAPDPVGTARRWGDVVGVPVAPGQDVLALDGGRQAVRVVAAATPAEVGITAVRVALPSLTRTSVATVAGVRFDLVPSEGAGEEET